MSCYQRSIYLLLTFIISKKLWAPSAKLYKSTVEVNNIEKKKKSVVNTFFLYQLFIKKYMSVSYSYKGIGTLSLILYVLVALIYFYSFRYYYASKNIYWELQKIWDYTLRSFTFL